MLLKEFEILPYEKQAELTAEFMKVRVTGIIHSGKFYNEITNLSRFTWGQWLTACDILSEVRSDIDIIKHLVLLFHFEDLTGKRYEREDDYTKYLHLSDLFDVVLAIPIVKKYIDLVAIQQDLIEKNISLPYTNEQAEAGIHKLEKFGSFGTLKALAGEGQEPSKVLNWNFNDVYLSLWFSTEQERINRNISSNILNKGK